MVEIFKQFLDIIRYDGLEKFHRYYGLYRGKVLNTVESENPGEVEIAVLEITGDENSAMANTALPRYPLFWELPPRVGDWVWIQFEQGDPRFPVYDGYWPGTNDRVADFAPAQGQQPTKRGIQTASGHRMLFDDTSGSEQIVIRHKNQTTIITFDTNGDMIIDAGAAKVQVKSTTEIDIGNDALAGPLVEEELVKKTSLNTGSGHVHVTSQGLTSGPMGSGGVGSADVFPGYVTTILKGN